MYIFDYDNMHSNVYNRLNSIMGALRHYTVHNNKNMVINRMYLSNNEIKLNISIDGNMFLLTSDDKLFISQFDYGKKVSVKYEIHLVDIIDGKFLNNFI